MRNEKMGFKILFISNTANFSKFNRPFMRWFKEQNWRVDYASAGEETIFDCDNQYAIPIGRDPFNVKNIWAYIQLRRIVLLNNYDIIHCHTPTGSVLGRLVAKSTKAKVIYTAHGFHFYRGAPLINWVLYYPIEKYLIKYTDTLVTINDEDYDMAKKYFSSCKNICKINGVGVDLGKFKPCDRITKNELRKNMGYKETDFIILYVAEFIPRKNHELFINSIKKLKKQIRQLKIIFAGSGLMFDKYKNVIEDMQLSDTVNFLGYRSDIDILCNIADVGVSTSKQEGLPVGVVEYFFSGLPVVCSKIRGHIDVIIDKKNGFLFDLEEPNQMNDAIIRLHEDKSLRKTIVQNNLDLREKYSLGNAVVKMGDIYKRCIYE